MVTAPGATAVTSPVFSSTVATAALLVDHLTGNLSLSFPLGRTTVAVSWILSPGWRRVEAGAAIVTPPAFACAPAVASTTAALGVGGVVGASGPHETTAGMRLTSVASRATRRERFIVTSAREDQRRFLRSDAVLDPHRSTT